MEIGMVRLMVAVAIGLAAGAGLVGYYADRAIRALRGELNYMRRICNDGIRSKGRL